MFKYIVLYKYIYRMNRNMIYVLLFSGKFLLFI